MNGRASASGRHVALETAPSLTPAPPKPAAARRPPLPEAPRRVRVGMPQLDAGGLSENWLLRYAGDLQWEAIARQLGVASDEIRGAGGERLYPTVVAVRARYAAPLAAVRENDVLDARVEVVPVRRACAWGRIAVSCDSDGGPAGGATPGGAAADRLLSLELLTTFAIRDRVPGAPPSLKMMPPAAALADSWTAAIPAGAPPEVVRLARAARRGEPLDDDFAGPILARAAEPHANPPLGATVYEPSPYSDYNGAGLLYFASYVTIADTAERHLVRRLGLADPRDGDWALVTSAIRRDVYYLENLPLGASLTAQLLGFEVTAHATSSHVRLVRTEDGRRMAEVITRRRRLGASPGGRP